MNKFGSLISKYRNYASNKSRLLDDDGHIDLQLKRLTNLGDPKSEKDTMSLKNVKIILSNFKGEAFNQQIRTIQYLSEDILRLTKIYQSPDNILPKSNKRRYLRRK